ncbi:uncharacterized protein LOC115034131 [Acyrthosiphon pisum]|uniref:MULE transposase domain-containing protein n=1 Tax=Acyrthosiphon pisum TaxID=7029 RepID=A0A8R2JTD4_ACYPI|nr:uncharacterized protein LOC115034131 [Acyrthosiphon pisum]
MELLKVSKIPGKKRGTHVFKGDDSNMYHQKEVSGDNTIVRCQLWRKKDQHCPAKGKIPLGTNDLYLYTPHKHNQPDKLLIKKLKKQLIEKAKTQNLKNRLIFNEVLSQPEFSGINVPFKEMKRQMSRAKRLNHPPEPNSLNEFKLQMEGTYANNMTMDGECFYVGTAGDGGNEGFSVVFIAPKLKKILSSGTDFIMDGTFKAAPKFRGECIQLFVIMGIAMDVGFPIVYALMSKKTEDAYCALFHFIKTEIEVNWNPLSVAIDFEKASIAAVRKIFPTANIFGCFFHHSQCIWRKIQQKGLTQLYRNNSLVNKLIRMFMAIPLLPQHKTREGFDTLIEFYHVELEDQLDAIQKHQLNDFFRYYLKTWISGHLGSILSVFNRVRRTNNSLEVSHRHLMAHIGIPNPSPWLFVDKLLAYSRGTVNDFILAEDGVDITEKLPRKWKKQNKRIRVATERLQERRFNVLEFLKYTKHSTPLFDLENDEGGTLNLTF